MNAGNPTGGVIGDLELAGAGLEGLRVERVATDEGVSERAIAVVEIAGGGGEALDARAVRRLLGSSARLTLRREDGSGTRRRFCGVLRRVEQAWRAGAGRLRLRIEPAFACLEEERLTRAFVGKSAIEILRAIVGPHLASLGGRRFELRLPGEPRGPAGPAGFDRCDDGFPRRDLCVQYGETSYDFCRRLMAEEGLSYYFDHGDGDGADGADDDGGGACERLIIVDGPRFEHRSAPVLLAPRRGMEARGESVFGLSRLTALASGAEAADTTAGLGDVLELAAGRVFRLAGTNLAIPVWLDDGEVLITSVRHRVDAGECPSGTDSGSRRYENDFTCVPAQRGCRPAAIAKPLALEDWGTVVSAGGDPIDADRQGRVRISFLYDRRQNVAAAARSPPIPVNQGWSGDGYGTQILPRAGMLARIEYVRGDPDRPVVAACLPTAENVLPAPPPPAKARLTLRTHGLRGGGQDDDDQHSNELALDDTAGCEEVWIRAGRDHVRRVLRDERTMIDRDESRVVGGSQALHVLGDRAKLVGAGEDVRVGGSRSIDVGADEERMIGTGPTPEGGCDALEIDGRSESLIDGGHPTVVEGSERAAFGGDRAIQVRGDATLTATKSREVTAGAGIEARQGPSAFTLAEGQTRVTAERQVVLVNEGGALVLDGKGESALMLPRIELVCGPSSVTIGDGKLVVKAPAVVARGAGGRIALDSAGAATIGQVVTSSAVGLNAIKGLPVIFSDSPGNPPVPAAEDTIVRNDEGSRDGGSA